MRNLSFRNIRVFICVALTLALAGGAVHAQSSAPKRPRITGISHANYFVSDLTRAIAFWHDFLGYDESYVLNKPDGTGVRIAFIKVNDRQHIELDNEPPTHPPSMLSHICFTVDDIEAMRVYLRSKGVDVAQGELSKNHAGDYSFQIKDPNGMMVEFVQTLTDGFEGKAAGKFMPATRISDRINQLGFVVGDGEKAIDFYGNILGFKEIGRGGENSNTRGWINMCVPDGNDSVKIMLNPMPADKHATTSHISLAVPDINKAVAILKSRPVYEIYGKDLTVANQKREVYIYDPDGTLVELTSPNAAGGK